MTFSNKKFNPIIFIGMHRSGTSLVGRSLEQLGLFVGRQKDKNNEAIFFLQMNTWLMNQCGARWDQPEPIADLWENAAKAVLEASKNYALDLMESPRAISYSGLSRYVMNRSISKLQSPWGWKDPRNTYTLPFWTKIFPEAKVIYIERHGVDVAQSLRVRANQSAKITTEKYRRFRQLAWFHPKRGGFSDSPRCLSLEGGFSLWEAYQNQARDILQGISKEQILQIRYEDFLKEPEVLLTEACKFCALPVNADKLRKVTGSINYSRALSYRNNEELRNFATHQRERLDKWRYEP